jgi:NAD(P)-dependent dehydrogenase (short-subunit alcohol dehydrogenase family)
MNSGCENEANKPLRSPAISGDRFLLSNQEKAVDEFGRIDVLVNNAAHQMSFNAIEEIEEISDEEWEKTLSTNISAMFYIKRRDSEFHGRARLAFG